MPIKEKTTLIRFLTESKGFEIEPPKERGLTVSLYARACAAYCPETHVLLLERSARLTDETEPEWVPKDQPEALLVASMAVAIRTAVKAHDAWFSRCAAAAAARRGEPVPPNPFEAIARLVDQLRASGHEGDEESGQHDEDCQACTIEALKAAVADLQGKS